MQDVFSWKNIMFNVLNSVFSNENGCNEIMDAEDHFNDDEQYDDDDDEDDDGNYEEQYGLDFKTLYLYLDVHVHVHIHVHVHLQYHERKELNCKGLTYQDDNQDDDIDLAAISDIRKSSLSYRKNGRIQICLPYG